MRVRFELIGLRTVPKVESSSHVPASPNPSNGPGPTPRARPRARELMSGECTSAAGRSGYDGVHA